MQKRKNKPTEVPKTKFAKHTQNLEALGDELLSMLMQSAPIASVQNFLTKNKFTAKMINSFHACVFPSCVRYSPFRWTPLQVLLSAQSFVF